jgi:hypothetical protein
LLHLDLHSAGTEPSQPAINYSDSRDNLQKQLGSAKDY